MDLSHLVLTRRIILFPVALFKISNFMLKNLKGDFKLSDLPYFKSLIETVTLEHQGNRLFCGSESFWSDQDVQIRQTLLLNFKQVALVGSLPWKCFPVRSCLSFTKSAQRSTARNIRNQWGCLCQWHWMYSHSTRDRHWANRDKMMGVQFQSPNCSDLSGIRKRSQIRNSSCACKSSVAPAGRHSFVLFKDFSCF